MQVGFGGIGCVDSYGCQGVFCVSCCMVWFVLISSRFVSSNVCCICVCDNGRCVSSMFSRKKYIQGSKGWKLLNNRLCVVFGYCQRLVYFSVCQFQFWLQFQCSSVQNDLVVRLVMLVSSICGDVCSYSIVSVKYIVQQCRMLVGNRVRLSRFSISRNSVCCQVCVLVGIQLRCCVVSIRLSLVRVMKVVEVLFFRKWKMIVNYLVFFVGMVIVRWKLISIMLVSVRYCVRLRLCNCWLIVFMCVY